MNKTIQEPSRNEIWKMFDQISTTYDRVNRVMTLGLDQYWRKQMRRFLPKGNHLKLLDCATGTGDQIIVLMEKSNRVSEAIGIDLAEAMVAIGVEKIGKKPYAAAVSMQVASALEIPFPDATFDCVTISFGIRNVTDVSLALREFFRVLKPGGRLLILEGTVPSNPLFKAFHLFYLRHFLPRIGGFISKKQSAYRYLNETIETFPRGKAFVQLMEAAGFRQACAHPLTAGVATIYQGDKGDE